MVFTIWQDKKVELLILFNKKNLFKTQHNFRFLHILLKKQLQESDILYPIP